MKVLVGERDLLYLHLHIKQHIVYIIYNPVSPLETVQNDDSTISITYSRPFKKDRLIFGKESDTALVPYGKYWRTGANAATTFETSGAVSFIGEKLDPGKYRLYTVPGEKEWKIVLNSEGDKFFAISEHSKSIFPLII